MHRVKKPRAEQAAEMWSFLVPKTAILCANVFSHFTGTLAFTLHCAELWR